MCFIPSANLFVTAVRHLVDMGLTRVEPLWRRPASLANYRTAVSLHSHTLYSREMLDFIPRVSRRIPGLRAAIEHAAQTSAVRWHSAWWTPPLGPHQAWEVEASQIARDLNMAPLVSITDHDNIEAPTQLRVLPEFAGVPLSVEWTINWQGTFFHLGVHNLPNPDLWSAMDSAPERQVPELLATLHELPGVLTVFNHPYWDEKGVGVNLHVNAARNLLRRCGRFIHAIELNGMRPWSENKLSWQLAEEVGKPAVSGGDRHGREPNACLNLTNAATFAEFVAEVRQGHSHVLFLPQYRENRFFRIAHHIYDVLRHDAAHGLGWHSWNDRIFYQYRDGRIVSMRELWGDAPPLIIRAFLAGVDLMSHARLRSTLRAALPPSEELA
jgi:hypothetical protein